MRKQLILINKSRRRMKRAFKVCCLLLVSCVLAALITPAQSINILFTGSIPDQVNSNSAVNVANEGTEVQRPAISDELDAAAELPADLYVLEVECGRFLPMIILLGKPHRIIGGAR